MPLIYRDNELGIDNSIGQLNSPFVCNSGVIELIGDGIYSFLDGNFQLIDPNEINNFNNRRAIDIKNGCSSIPNSATSKIIPNDSEFLVLHNGVKYRGTAPITNGNQFYSAIRCDENTPTPTPTSTPTPTPTIIPE
jgi:hypothetical protein